MINNFFPCWFDVSWKIIFNITDLIFTNYNKLLPFSVFTGTAPAVDKIGTDVFCPESMIKEIFRTCEKEIKSQ